MWMGFQYLFHFPVKNEEKNIQGLVQAALFSDLADLLESDFHVWRKPVQAEDHDLEEMSIIFLPSAHPSFSGFTSE